MMAGFAPQVLPPPVLPVQPADVVWPSEQQPDDDLSDLSIDVSPTVMTIAMVGPTNTRWGTADVVAHLAGLAVTDELVVVYGADQSQYCAGVPAAGVQAVVAGLRHLLPRHIVVVLYAVPYHGALHNEAALLDELLDLGSLPIVVTPPETVSEVATELQYHLHADRVLKLISTQPAVPGIGSANLGGAG